MSGFRFVAVLVTVLWLAGCGGRDDGRIALGPDDQAAAEDELYPAFRAIQVDVEPPGEALDALFRAAFEPLQAGLPEGASPVLWTTGEADADAGCLAGGRIFVTQGLLAWIEHPDELTGALAAALGQCPAARRAWEARDRAELAPVDGEHALLARYRDYRLPENAALMAQLMLRGCGGRDCFAAATERLEAAGRSADGLARLGQRLAAQRPDAAWLDRLGRRAFPPAAAAVGNGLAGVLDDVHAKREGLGQLAEVKRAMYAGELGDAYRRVLRARRALDNEFEAELVFAELSLLNYHPDSAERSIERLLATGRELPQADFLWGVQAAQSRRVELGRQRLEASLSTLPRVFAHFQLAILLHRSWETDAALPHYRIVAAAEPGHPSSAPAASYIAQIEGQGQ
ncbi:hypothetical protein HFP89_15110 [Wenzhouxiangella sp. XN79A]|uniref:hypothetical protein n=1 Tax=Wenzhouxiangella sp. XN79A TaxID=2724193 RepID=UPI00144A75E4|nr:hypothetical protein [Wenzhouxiangella sp. XN79A]NKI36498.1 hypothetical protein [Wenzhouxiangella sp. XN79A]